MKKNLIIIGLFLVFSWGCCNDTPKKVLIMGEIKITCDSAVINKDKKEIIYFNEELKTTVPYTEPLDIK